MWQVRLTEIKPTFHVIQSTQPKLLEQIFPTSPLLLHSLVLPKILLLGVKSKVRVCSGREENHQKSHVPPKEGLSHWNKYCHAAGMVPLVLQMWKEPPWKACGINIFLGLRRQFSYTRIAKPYIIKINVDKCRIVFHLFLWIQYKIH